MKIAVKKTAARKPAVKVCREKRLSAAEEAAFMAALDSQTRDIVKRIQRLKRVL